MRYRLSCAGFYLMVGKQGGYQWIVASGRCKLLFFRRAIVIAGHRQIPIRDFPAVAAAAFPAMVPALQQFFLKNALIRTVAFAYISFAAGTCGSRRKGKRNH